MSIVGRPPHRRGSKKSTDVRVGILNGKPSLQVNWGGRIYGAQLSLVGAGSTQDSLVVSDITASGNITFGKNSAVYNNSNKILMVGGFRASGDKNMSIGTETNLSSLIGHADNTNNIAIGDKVMKSTIYITESVAIGEEAMMNIGQNASDNAVANSANVAIGYQVVIHLEQIVVLFSVI